MAPPAVGLPILAALAAIAGVALADQGNLRGSAVQPWDYKSFHVGNWPSRGYHLCAGLPDVGENHNEWQSPIDIPVPEGDEARAEDGESLELTANGDGCHSVRMVHNAHTWEANFAELGCTNLVARWKGKSYTMQQMHFHVESENMLGGHHKEGEIHMVHKADDGTLLVIGQFMQRSREVADQSPFLNEVFRLLKLTMQDIELSGVVMNPYAGLLRKGQEFHSFLGSLTTPPCTPGVEWVVMREPISISSGDMDTFGKYLKTEAGNQADSYGHDMRPVQPLNKRPIALGAISTANFAGDGIGGAPALDP